MQQKNKTESRLSGLARLVNSKVFLWLILAYPFGWLLNAWRLSDLYYGETIHLSGELSARLLILTMAITPLRLWFPGSRWTSWLGHRRRYFGVASFAYALLHTVIYLDRKRSLELILKEGADFSMWTGWIALSIFALLFVTSNDRAVRYLKQGWKKLHRWVYLAAVLTFLHWIFVAFDFVPGLVHFLILLALELSRLWKRRTVNSNAT